MSEIVLYYSLVAPQPGTGRRPEETGREVAAGVEFDAAQAMAEYPMVRVCPIGSVVEGCVGESGEFA